MDEKLVGLLNHEISDSRSTVIDNAVKIEFLISSLLIRVFGLNEFSSISFGNTSSALSFIAKINLLLDLKILIKEDKEKFKTFAEIRNQFAHNFMVMSLNDCPEEILKKLRTWYKPKTDIKEISDFQPLYNGLYVDVKNGIEKLLITVTEMAGKKGEELGKLTFNSILFEQIVEYSKSDSEFKTKYMSLMHKATKIYEDNPPSDDSINYLPLL